MHKLLTRGMVVLVAVTILGSASLAQTRIRFARGRTSASVSSSIGGKSQRKYMLAAREGQTLSANVSSRNGCVVLGNQETSTSYETDAGDNYIDLFNRCGTATSFTLTVSVY
jgi:hypothetical protein